MELCIGTVQFGMDYGINGKKRTPVSECIACFDYAIQNGIRAIDTAEAYGDAEEILGKYLRRKPIPRDKLFISTKMLPNFLDNQDHSDYYPLIRKHLEGSLRRIGVDYVDAYLFHSSRYAFRPELLDALSRVKQDGLAGKVGVSVYYPEEAFACMENPNISFIQAPYSILDHRMKESGVFDASAENAVELHTRSAFLQGLVLMSPSEVPQYLQKAVPFIERINQICRDLQISPVELAMLYVKCESAVSHLVFGVHSLAQLQENIRLFRGNLKKTERAAIEQALGHIDAEIVIPRLWKK